MKLGTINKLLAVVAVVGLGVLLLPRMPQNERISGLLSEVLKPEEPSLKLANNWGAATHYAPDENLEGIDIGVLDHARSRVDAAMNSFTDRPIELELETLAKHRVQIRLYRDQEQYREEKKRAQERGETCVTDELCSNGKCRSQNQVG